MVREAKDRLMLRVRSLISQRSLIDRGLELQPSINVKAQRTRIANFLKSISTVKFAKEYLII